MSLGEIAERNKGTDITAGKMKKIHCNGAPIRIFAGGNTIADCNYGDIPDKDIISKPSIIVKSRGYIGFEYYDKPFSHKNEFWSYSISDNNINLKFVYYYLLTTTDKLQKLAKSRTVRIPQIAISDTDTLEIPVPPLEIQEQIVDEADKEQKIIDANKELIKIMERRIAEVLTSFL